MATRWASVRWGVERWSEPFVIPEPGSTKSVLWRGVRWGLERWAQRGIALAGAVCLISDELVTVCTATASIQGGESDVANEYTLGNVIRIEGSFETDGIPVDPADVIGIIKSPSGNYTSFTLGDNLVNDATGEYHFTFFPIEEGRHEYRIAGTGSSISAAEGYFVVKESLFN
jgi:hypothetical protein